MRCNCEDYPCCGHTDNDESSPFADMSDAEIKDMVYRTDEDEFDAFDREDLS